MDFISSNEKEGKIIVYTLTERGKDALRISISWSFSLKQQ
jgi:hypothetical protein